MECQHKILFESQPFKKPQQCKHIQKELDGKEPGKKPKLRIRGVLVPGGPPSLAVFPLLPLPKQEHQLQCHHRTFNDQHL